MANEKAVRQYLAYWFQAGKRVVLEAKGESYCPQVILQGDRYSPEFEACWNYLSDASSGDCYLEGTSQTIQELLSSKWEIAPCARCDMPVPMLVLGVMPLGCPCFDLPTWPNSDIPQPRSPVNTPEQLVQIRDRLLANTHHSSETRNGVSIDNKHRVHEAEESSTDQGNVALAKIRDRLRQQGQQSKR